MKRVVLPLFFSILILFLAFSPLVQAQEFVPDVVTYEKAKVIEVLKDEVRPIPGTYNKETYQSIKAKLLDGSSAGQ